MMDTSFTNNVLYQRKYGLIFTLVPLHRDDSDTILDAGHISSRLPFVVRLSNRMKSMSDNVEWKKLIYKNKISSACLYAAAGGQNRIDAVMDSMSDSYMYVNYVTIKCYLCQAQLCRAKKKDYKNKNC